MFGVGGGGVTEARGARALGRGAGGRHSGSSLHPGPRGSSMALSHWLEQVQRGLPAPQHLHATGRDTLANTFLMVILTVLFEDSVY